MHGATDYGGYNLEGLKMLAVRSGKVVRDNPWLPWAAGIQAGRGCPGFLARLGDSSGQRPAPKGGTEGIDEARHTLRTVRYGGQGRKM